MASNINRCARRSAGLDLLSRAFASAGVFAFVLLWSAAAGAQQARPVTNGVYTPAQAARGQTLYNQQCATCHGATLGGAQAPPLAGDEFIRTWAGPVADLVNKIQSTMPANDPGKLTRPQAADILAYVLQVGKFPAGQAELGAEDTTLKLITLPAVAASAARPAAAAAAGSTPSFPPAGNMAQLMRGILFPSSNLIFNVQGRDPGAPLPARPAAGQPTSGAFPWADWGAGIYTGWELVDYAAVALAESAPLMLTPGRRCENGKLVPVTDPDWIKFSIELADAGKAAYKAAQTRKQDVVSEATDIVATACSHCHEAYRDKPGPRTVTDPSNKAARCVR